MEWHFVLLPESLRSGYACTFGLRRIYCGRLQSSVSMRSSSLRTPESVTPSAVISPFPAYVIRKLFNLCLIIAYLPGKVKVFLQVFRLFLAKFFIHRQDTEKGQVLPCPFATYSVQIRSRRPAGVLAHGGDQLEADLSGRQDGGLDRRSIS